MSLRVACGGMYRSGGTWQFNACRLLMIAASMKPTWGSSAFDDCGIIARNCCCVIKAHTWKDMYSKYDIILTAHRDLRDVVASCHRQFGDPMTLELADDAFSRYLPWTRHCRYDSHYERMIQDKPGEMRVLAEILGIGGLDFDAVLREVEGLSCSGNILDVRKHAPRNLLHPGHITDGRYGSWKGLMPEEVANEITAKHWIWMRGKGYL